MAIQSTCVRRYDRLAAFVVGAAGLRHAVVHAESAHACFNTDRTGSVRLLGWDGSRAHAHRVPSPVTRQGVKMADGSKAIRWQPSGWPAWLAAISLAILGCSGEVGSERVRPVDAADAEQPGDTAMEGGLLISKPAAKPEDQADCVQPLKVPTTALPLSFAEPIDVSEGQVLDPTAMDVADLNGDGFRDIGAFRRGTLVWFESPSDGQGAWKQHEFTVPEVVRKFVGAAAFGDIDGDGDSDLVVSMDQHMEEDRSAYIYWWENPGGALATEQPWEIRSVLEDADVGHINDMALADMDSDGQLDIVARSLLPNQMHIFFQDAARNSAWVHREIDATPFGVEGEGFSVGNIDDAGHNDISICGHWLQAGKNPREDAYATYGIDAGYIEVNANCKERLGDIDGDGRLDVVISPAEGYREGQNHWLAWYKGPEDPTKVSAWKRTVLAEDLNGAHTVVLADMDADRDLDVVSGVAWDMWGQSKTIRIYRNQGAGRFDGGEVIASDKGLYSGIVADIGDDGDLDIVGQETYEKGARPLYYESLAMASPTCDDGRRNQAELHVDCGGPCKPCPEEFCGNGVVDPGEGCDDGNVEEGDGCPADCDWDPCAEGSAAQETVECQDMSGDRCGGSDNDSCTSMVTEPSCDDGVQNQGEEGRDCGGPCASCAEMTLCE